MDDDRVVLSTDATFAEEYRRLREKLSPRQVLSLIEAIGRAQERAIERKCNQSITIHFNANGHPRYLDVSDSVELKP